MVKTPTKWTPAQGNAVTTTDDSPEERVTEAGETRVTEASVTRVLETTTVTPKPPTTWS